MDGLSTGDERSPTIGHDSTTVWFTESLLKVGVMFFLLSKLDRVVVLLEEAYQAAVYVGAYEHCFVLANCWIRRTSLQH